MSVYIGNVDFSPISGYGEITGDMSSVNSTVFITEGKVVKINNGYAFCVIAEGISDLAKSSKWQTGDKACWIAHSKDYERYSFEKKGRETVQPAELEKTVIGWLESTGSQWLEKSFRGKLHLNGAESVLTAVKASNLWHILCDFAECEPSLIKDISTANTGGGKNRPTGQSESQKLTDRQAFMITAAGAHGQGCNNLADLSVSLNAMQEDSHEIFKVFMSLLAIAIK